MMRVCRIVIDTNVILSALRSSRGASFKLLSLIDKNLFDLSLSVPPFLEYETVIKRNKSQLQLEDSEIDDILDYIAKIGKKRNIYFLWRPFLKDIKDDFVLEVAMESRSDFIISYNKKDFKNANQLGITVFTPQEFLRLIKVIP